MKAKEIELLNILKLKVDDIAGLGPSSDWKQRDFMNLIDQIHKSSGIILSLSTIRRIWIKYHTPGVSGVAKWVGKNLVMTLFYQILH